MKLPQFIEQFVRHHFQPRHVERVLDEFIEYASDGRGGSKYTHETTANLIASYQVGRDPQRLNYFGR